MRILALNWQDLKNPQAGGAEVHLEEILTRLVSFGHQVDLLCSNYEGGSKTDNKSGIKIYRTGSRYNFNLVAPFALKKLLKKNSYNVVMEDINKIPFYSPLYHKLPTMVIIPHLFADTIFKEINFVLGSYIYLAEKPVPFVYKNNRFMVISQSTAEEVEKKGIPRGNIEVVECGIDKNVYKFDPEIDKFKRPTMIYVGRLKKYKSIETVINAIPIIKESIPDVRLIIIGSGEYREKLEHIVAEKELKDCIEFKGFIPQAEKVTYLRRSHISIYPSLKEGWGLTNIEANACGTSVMAARVPGLQDSVSDGNSGLLFEFGDINQIAALSVKLLSDHDYRRSIEMGGLRWAANFSWETTAKKTEEILKRIISQK
jgi:glycosyltransferase involved in cell wall biosynthesis